MVLPVRRAFVFNALVAFVNCVLEDAHSCVAGGVDVFVWHGNAFWVSTS